MPMTPRPPSRRDLLALAASACVPRRASAAGERGMMMWDYLMRELSAADERRRRALVGIQTKSRLAALQDRVRRIMHSGIGPFPERYLLRAQHVGEIAKPDYVIEKII